MVNIQLDAKKQEVKLNAPHESEIVLTNKGTAISQPLAVGTALVLLTLDRGEYYAK